MTEYNESEVLAHERREAREEERERMAEACMQNGILSLSLIMTLSKLSEREIKAIAKAHGFVLV